jgi:hypothetical protein
VRRLNGLGSEHALASYAHLAVPARLRQAAAAEGEGEGESAWQERRAAVRFLGPARREVLLLLPPSADEGASEEDEVDKQEEQEREDPRSRRRQPAVAEAAEGQQQQQQQHERRREGGVIGLAGRRGAAAPTGKFGALLRRKLREYVSRAARVDPSAASFYLDEAGGDVASALRAARDDDAWADRSAVRPSARARAAPLRAWMEAEGALARA